LVSIQFTVQDFAPPPLPYHPPPKPPTSCVILGCLKFTLLHSLECQDPRLKAATHADTFLVVLLDVMEASPIAQAAPIFAYVEQSLPYMKTQFKNKVDGNASPKLALLKFCNLLLKRLSRWALAYPAPPLPPPPFCRKAASLLSQTPKIIGGA